MSRPVNLTLTPEQFADMAVMTPVEYAFVGVEAFLHLLSFSLLLYINWHRNYLPLKVLQIPFVNVAFIGGVIWWLGALSVLRIVPQVDNPVFLLCSLWGIWVQVVFGIFLFVASLFLRFFRLFAIVKLKWNMSGWRSWAALLVIWSPILVYGIITTALSVNGPAVDVQTGIKLCHFQPAGFFSLMALLAAYIVGLMFGMISLRGIKQRYIREYKDSVWASVFFMTVYVTYLIIIALDLQWQVWGRLLNSVLVSTVPTFFLWFSAGYPAYKCLTDHDAFEAQFKDNFRNVSLESGKKNTVSSSKVSLSHKEKEMTTTAASIPLHETQAA